MSVRGINMQIDAIPSDPNVRDTVIGILKQRFGDQFTTSDAIRERHGNCLLYTSPSPRDGLLYRMPSSA